MLSESEKIKIKLNALNAHKIIIYIYIRSHWKNRTL